MPKFSLKTDKLVCGMAIGYVILPVIVFAFGWTRLWIALIGLFLFCFLSYRLFLSLADAGNFSLSIYKPVWISAFVALALWVILSGIGGYAFQNQDFWARNPIYRDLCNYSWPVIYDLSHEPLHAQEVFGTGSVAFSYYFSWWLPVALVSKIFGIGELGRSFLLYIWALAGVFLAFYLVCRKLGKVSGCIVAVFIGFSGLDAIPHILINSILNGFISVFPWTYHIEWWADYFQYSSNTTQLFWVFNQAIPIWILIGLFLQLKDSKYLIGLISLSFAYSPWATLGMVPFAVWGSVRNKKAIKDSFNVVNIISAIYMMMVYGLFYGSSTGSEGYLGLIFGIYPGRTFDILFWYALFAFFEFGLFYIIIGKRIRDYEYGLLSVFLLLILPFLHILEIDFVMRASIMPLFMTMVFVLAFLNERSDDKRVRIKKYLLIIALCIGALTPLAEIGRSVSRTITYENYLQEEVGSLGYFESTRAFYLNETQKQYFIYDYENTPFFKYLAK